MVKSYKSEDRIQQECYMWFHNTYPQYRGLLFAVPNGGARSAVQGKIFKMTGVVPGVADMLLMVNGNIFCFELKNKFGTQSPQQKNWQLLVQREGFKYYIVRTKKLFEEIVTNIMNNINENN